MPKPEHPKYHVLKDTREQAGWSFEPSRNCSGMTVGKLATGDYSIVGREHSLIIERKGSVAELAGNVYQARFERELERMMNFSHPFVVAEFGLADVIRYPEGAGLPASAKARARLTGYSFLRRLTELQLAYPSVHWIWAGGEAKAFVASLFKRAIEAA